MGWTRVIEEENFAALSEAPRTALVQESGGVGEVIET